MNVSVAEDFHPVNPYSFVSKRYKLHSGMIANEPYSTVLVAISFPFFSSKKVTLNVTTSYIGDLFGVRNGFGGHFFLPLLFFARDCQGKHHTGYQSKAKQS